MWLSSTHLTCRSPLPRRGQCADRLFRWKHNHNHDICLELKVFEMIDHRYGPHSVDLFATQDSRLLDRYVSWRPDLLAVIIDAFMLPLKGENLYCFPLVTCIPRLLREVLRRQVTVTLVAPDWQAAWRPALYRLLLGPPLQLLSNSIKSTASTFSLESDLFFGFPGRTRGSQPLGRLHQLRCKVPTKTYLLSKTGKLQMLVPQRVPASLGLSRS